MRSPAALAALGFIAFTWLLGPVIGLVGTPRVGVSYGFLLPPSLAFCIVAALGRLFWRRRELDATEPARAPTEAWGEAWRRSRAAELSNARLASLGGVLLIYPAFMAAMAVWKTSLGHIQRYRWDPLFADVDRVMHGGRLPHEWLGGILSSGAAVKAFDVAYLLWFLIFIFGPVLVAWSPASPWRRRTLFAGVATWILLGVVVATALASAGPCYYAWATGATGAANPYEPLMARLRAIDSGGHYLVALRAQDYVLSTHTGTTELGQGISAFPSMHVAIATLAAAVAWERNRRAGLALSCFVLVILVGSVVLGWHYAADGYGSIVGVAAIWLGIRAAERALARRRPVTRAEPALAVGD